MIKQCIVGIYLLISVASYSQNSPKFLFGVSRNITVYNPNTKTVFRSHTNGNINGRSASAFLAVRVLEGPRISWYTGFSYRRVALLFKDRVKRVDYDYYYAINLYTSVSHVYKDPADQISISNNLGIYNEVLGQIWARNKFKGFVGGVAEVYLLEKYRSYYSSSDTLPGVDYTSYDNLPYPEVEKLPRAMYLSSINASAFFKVQRPLGDRLILGARISLGANIYSDWSQFRQYGWLGIGLELGFVSRTTKENRSEK